MKTIIGLGIIALLLAASCGSSKPAKPGGQEAAIDAAHNARNSLNWAGLYTGMIPAADAPGIAVEFALHENGTYQVVYRFVDRDSEAFTFSGDFTWDDAGRVIVLDSEEIPPYYAVGENTLTQLDMAGNQIDGDLAGNYVLKKSL